jgi:uncharacterized protein YjbJ (UPF0337 family)
MAGHEDKAAGKAKELMGKATGDERMEGEGKAQNVAGKAKEGAQEAADTAKGAVDGVKDAATRRNDRR